MKKHQGSARIGKRLKVLDDKEMVKKGEKGDKVYLQMLQQNDVIY